MDNNNFNGQNDRLSEQGMQDSGFSLKQDEVQQSDMGQSMPNGQPAMGQPMPNGQPAMGQSMPNDQPVMGQPMYNGMNNVPYGMDAQNGYIQPGMPVNGGGNGGSGKPPKVKKPMTKGKIAAIISGSVALLALIICGVIFIPRIFKPAKEVVIDAFENTFESNKGDMDYLDDLLGIDELVETYYDKGGDNVFTFTINDIAGVEGTDGLGISLTGKYDPVNKLVNSSLSGDYKETNLFTMNLIGNETTTYIQFKDIIDGYLSLPNEDTMIVLQNSPLGQEMGLEGMPDSDLDYFAASEDDDSAEVYSGYVDAVEGLWDSVTVEKQGKAKIDVNGNTVTAKEYYVTLDEVDIEDSICSAIDGASQAALADPAALESAGMDEATFNSTMEQIKNMVPSLISGDLVVKVYVADKKVVKVTASDDISLYGVSMAYDFYFDIDDENASGALKFSVMDQEVGVKFDVKDIHGNVNGTITAYAPDETVDINFNTTVSDTDAAYVIDFNLDVVYNASSVMALTYKNELNKSDNTFNGNLVCNITDAGTMEFPFSGGYRDIVKGQSFAMFIDSIGVMVDGESLINGSLEYSMSAGNASATDIDSSLPVYDLTTITYTDFENVILDNEDNFTNWMNNIISNTGELGEALNELFVGSDAGTEPEPDGGSSGLGDPDDIDEEDMVLQDGDVKVKILGTIDGFSLDYACSYFIDYYTEAYSMIEYTLYSNASIEDVMGDYAMPSDDTEIYAQEDNKTVKVGDEDAVYSMVQYDSYGEKVSKYRIAKMVEDGTYLVVDAVIYDADDSYNVEQLAAALGNQYYEIVTE